ncbi:MAG: 16S rRNA processing protein RimM [Selenomonadaceae bacterium]|nr:16S rRNA processing protein RimM [Selenomonadaceae bacterium]
MNSLFVKVPVVVKAKLTEKLKTRMIDEYTKVAEQMELELKQINIDRQRELDAHPEQSEQIARFFGNEIMQRQQRRGEALSRKETTQKLAIGAEIIQGTLEHQVELKVGDNFREVMNREILVEDDKVIAIRG